MIIHRLPVLSDNYIFVLEDEKMQTAAVVDPAESKPVLDFLKSKGLELKAIFNTHHHGDHVGGNRGLLAQFPDTIIYGGEFDDGRIPGQSVFLKDGDVVNFARREAKVFFVPGHTKAHIVYYFKPIENQCGELFCGDTIFAAGCGKLFEGTFAQMFNSLSTLRELPDETRVWCAHEYTQENMEIALQMCSKNEALKTRFERVLKARQKGEPTVPFLLGEEKESSPFFMWDNKDLQESMESQGDDLLTFTKVRQFRDRF